MVQVRNSAGGIVQLTYGEDGLDPVAMEAAEGKPINLARSLSVVHATTPRPASLPENAVQDGEMKHHCAKPPPCSNFLPLDFSRMAHLLRKLPGGVLDAWIHMANPHATALAGLLAKRLAVSVESLPSTYL